MFTFFFFHTNTHSNANKQYYWWWFRLRWKLEKCSFCRKKKKKNLLRVWRRKRRKKSIQQNKQQIWLIYSLNGNVWIFLQKNCFLFDFIFDESLQSFIDSTYTKSKSADSSSFILLSWILCNAIPAIHISAYKQYWRNIESNHWRKLIKKRTRQNMLQT